MSAVLQAVLAVVLLLAGAPAHGLDVHGVYDSPLGRVRIQGDGATFVGVVVEPSRRCPFPAGDEVLRATLLDDSLAGQLRVCLQGKGCPEEEWAGGVLLATAGKLSGAVHVAAKGCRAPVGKRGGVVFTRIASATPTSTSPSTSKTARARALMRDGAAWLAEGNFEAARARFLAAIETDGRIPEAYNGVGVTWRMRDDLAKALEWYKKALAVDPDFGDAYYNMACVYALEGRKGMALRYLQIAALNGYATAEGIDADPDLAALRSDAGYRALVRTKM
jgi:hypothetical protein